MGTLWAAEIPRGCWLDANGSLAAVGGHGCRLDVSTTSAGGDLFSDQRVQAINRLGRVVGCAGFDESQDRATVFVRAGEAEDTK